MDRYSRVDLMEKIAANAGILTSFVEKNLGLNKTQSSFKEQFAKMPPGQARENFIYNEIIKRGPPTQLVPITMNGPNGTKLTYHVMPDYVMIDGLRVTMAPSTAQRVADHFHMDLPTDEISKKIYDAADTKVRAAPLSGRGYRGADGKYYSGKDVAKTRIGQPDAAIAYNDLTDEEIKKQELKNGKPPQLIAGHMKDILRPVGDPKDVRMGGWHGENGVNLQPYTDNHRGGAKYHTEYGLGTRLVSNDVTVTYPDGKTETTTMDKLFPTTKKYV